MESQNNIKTEKLPQLPLIKFKWKFEILLTLFLICRIFYAVYSQSKYDFFLVDTAAGTHCDVIGALKQTDIALAVTEPTPLGKHDLELIIQLIKRLGIDFEIILNRFEEGKSNLIEAAAEKHGKKIKARIPYKKEIMQAYSKGVPVTDDSIEKIMRLIE